MSGLFPITVLGPAVTSLLSTGLERVLAREIDGEPRHGSAEAP